MTRKNLITTQYWLNLQSDHDLKVAAKATSTAAWPAPPNEEDLNV